MIKINLQFLYQTVLVSNYFVSLVTLRTTDINLFLYIFNAPHAYSFSSFCFFREALHRFEGRGEQIGGRFISKKLIDCAIRFSSVFLIVSVKVSHIFHNPPITVIKFTFSASSVGMLDIILLMVA